MARLEANPAAIYGPSGGERGRKSRAEQCAAAGPGAEGSALPSVIKPAWKHVDLKERKCNYRLPFVCDSNGFEPLPAPSESLGKDFEVQSHTVPATAPQVENNTGAGW